MEETQAPRNRMKEMRMASIAAAKLNRDDTLADPIQPMNTDEGQEESDSEDETDLDAQLDGILNEPHNGPHAALIRRAEANPRMFPCSFALPDDKFLNNYHDDVRECVVLALRSQSKADQENCSIREHCIRLIKVFDRAVRDRRAYKKTAFESRSRSGQLVAQIAELQAKIAKLEATCSAKRKRADSLVALLSSSIADLDAQLALHP